MPTVSYEHLLAVYKEQVSQCCRNEGINETGTNEFHLESFTILTKSPVTECLEDKSDKDEISGKNAVKVIKPKVYTNFERNILDNSV